VPRQQAASKNKSGQQIGFLAVDDLLKECEVVDEGDRGALVRQLNRTIEYGEATVKEIRDKTNEDLKAIVAERSKWSQLYTEIKDKAQITEKKKVSRMDRNVKVQIHDVQMTESQFVHCFKPRGHLCDDVIEIFRLILKESWKRHTIMLSRGAMVSAN
jgi:hypothetical protein